MSTQSINMAHAFEVIANFAKRGFILYRLNPILPPPKPPQVFFAPLANYEMLYSTLLLLSPAFKL